MAKNSSWMGLMGAYQKIDLVRAVIPTVMLPLAAASLALNALATLIAGWFGLKLKCEGPKRLIEVLIQPRVLISAVLLNLAIWGGYRLIVYYENAPYPLALIRWRNPGSDSLGAGFFTAHKYADQHGRSQVAEESARASVSGLKTQQIWHMQLAKGSFGAPVLSGASMFIGSDDGYAYELEESTGKVLRRFFVGNPISAEPLVWKNHLLLTEGVHDIHHARVYSFDLATGRLATSFATRGHIEGTPALASHQGLDLLFVAAGKDGLHALDPVTLKPRWHRVLGHTDSEAIISDGRVFFPTGIEKGFPQTERKAIALDFESGKTLWEHDLPTSGWMPGVFVGAEVCFGVGRVYLKSDFGQLVCFDQKTGAPGSVIAMEGPVLGIPIRVGSLVIVSDLDGRVCALSLPESRRLWCTPPHGTAFASPVALNSRWILYPSAKDGLLVLDPLSGKEMSRWVPSTEEGAWAKSQSRVIQGENGFYLSDSVGSVRKLNLAE